MKVGIAVAALAAFGAVSAQSAPITVDFDTMNGGIPSVAGNIIGDEFTDFGLTIGVAPANPSSTLALFNSNCGPDFPGVACTGNDGDLASGPTFGTAPQGRVLIINGGSDANPNDDPAGGMFVFSFNRPVRLDSVQILDLDEGAVGTLVNFEVTFAASITQMVAPSSIDLLSSVTGDNSLRSFNFSGVDNVSELKVEFDDISGAVASLTVEPIPVPAALPLMASVLGGAMAFQRWRTRRSA